MNFGLKYVGHNKLESTVITDYFDFGNRNDWEYLIDKLLEETLHTIEDTKYIALYDFDMSFDYNIYLKDFRNLYNHYEEMEIIFRGYIIDNENNKENITIKLLMDIYSIYDYISDEFGLKHYDKEYETEKYIEILKEAKESIFNDFEDYISYESAGRYLDTETYRVSDFNYYEILESEELIKEFSNYKLILLFGNKISDYYESEEFFELFEKKLNSLQENETSNTELNAEENKDSNSTNTEADKINVEKELANLAKMLHIDTGKKEPERNIHEESKKSEPVTEADKIEAFKQLKSISHLFQLDNVKKEPEQNIHEEVKKPEPVTEADKINAEKKLANLAKMLHIDTGKKEPELNIPEEVKKPVTITEDAKIEADKKLASIAHLFQLGNDKKEPERNTPEEIKKPVTITEADKINAEKKLSNLAQFFQLGNDKKEKEVKKELTPQEVIKAILGNQKLKMTNNKEYKDTIFKIMARVNNYDKEKMFKKLFKLKTNNEIKTQYFISQTPERTIIFIVDRFIVINNTTKKYMLSKPMTNKRDFIEDFIKYLPITSEEKKYFYTVLKKSYLFYNE